MSRLSIFIIKPVSLSVIKTDKFKDCVPIWKLILQNSPC